MSKQHNAAEFTAWIPLHVAAAPTGSMMDQGAANSRPTARIRARILILNPEPTCIRGSKYAGGE